MNPEDLLRSAQYEISDTAGELAGRADAITEKELRGYIAKFIRLADDLGALGQ